MNYLSKDGTLMIWKENRIIKNDDIPNSVTKIRFGYYFNQPKECICVPESVQTIYYQNVCYKKGTEEFDNKFTVYHIM